MIEDERYSIKGVTPGDWSIVRTEGHIFIVAPGAHGTKIPVAEILMGGNRREQDANAALVAAAKPLYSFASRAMANYRFVPRDQQQGAGVLQKAQGRIP